MNSPGDRMGILSTERHSGLKNHLKGALDRAKVEKCRAIYRVMLFTACSEHSPCGRGETDATRAMSGTSARLLISRRPVARRTDAELPRMRASAGKM